MMFQGAPPAHAAEQKQMTIIVMVFLLFSLLKGLAFLQKWQGL